MKRRRQYAHNLLKIDEEKEKLSTREDIPRKEINVRKHDAANKKCRRNSIRRPGTDSQNSLVSIPWRIG